MRLSTLWLIGLLFLACNAGEKTSKEAGNQEKEDPWAKVGDVLGNISDPEISNRTFSVMDHGAKADGEFDNKESFKKAIEACHASGGGKVVIPAGTYLCNGPIHMLSNVELHLKKNATVYFGTDPSFYLPVVFTRWEGVECYNYSPLIYAFEQENIAITGKGTLDGQAGNDNWWPWCGKDSYGWKEGMPHQGEEHSRPTLFGWNTQEVPVEERILGEGSYLRPNFIQPYRCENVLIEGVTIKNSPMWIIHPVLCDNVTVRGVTVISHGPNSDGCDPESSRNVLIEDCFFDTGDDCIALKSGRNQDGRRIGRPVENVVVRDCMMKDGHGGVVVGSEVSGGARNIFAENCKMDSPNLDRALRVKTNKVRGGTIENLYFRNITVGEVREAVLKVNMRYPIYSDTNQTYIPEVGNIYLENVTSEKSKYGILINGYSKDSPVRNVNLKDCNFQGAGQPTSIEYATDLTFENVMINGTVMESPEPKKKPINQ